MPRAGRHDTLTVRHVSYRHPGSRPRREVSQGLRLLHRHPHRIDAGARQPGRGLGRRTSKQGVSRFAEPGQQPRTTAGPGRPSTSPGTHCEKCSAPWRGRVAGAHQDLRHYFRWTLIRTITRLRTRLRGTSPDQAEDWAPLAAHRNLLLHPPAAGDMDDLGGTVLSRIANAAAANSPSEVGARGGISRDYETGPGRHWPSASARWASGPLNDD